MVSVLSFREKKFGVLAVSINQDIYKKGESEQYLKEIANVISDSLYRYQTEKWKKRFHDAIMIIPEPISIISADYRYSEVNEEYAEYYGIARDEIVNKKVEKFIGHKNYNTIIKPNLDECLSGKSVHFDFTMVYKTKGPREMFVNYYQ